MESAKDVDSHQRADREKRWVALSSVLAAVFLTTMKLVVGLMTGSLGILSEAVHSGLDLAAAAMTLFAVRVSGRPADREHTYGHGKVENLSALFEAVLLLVTCVWIIYEAIQRLFFKHVVVEASIWAFLIMGISIVVDFSRSRALARVAKKYDSQALEADALHFSTDIWSSSVVIVGPIGLAWSGWPRPTPWPRWGWPGSSST
jgi:cation diffusion facilitator family transporter